MTKNNSFLSTLLFHVLSTTAPLLLLLLLLPQIVSSQSSSLSDSSIDYLLTPQILEYTNTVATLAVAAADPDLPDNMATLAARESFNRLSYYWEIPNQSAASEFEPDQQFSQVLLGRQQRTCYGVFHGLPLADNNRFVPIPTALPSVDLKRKNCDSNSNGGGEDCSCKAQWIWVDINFPQYWLELQGQMVTCMDECETRYGEGDCDLVLGGHGQGGMVAQLLSFRLAATFGLDPYVITTGSANVLYDDDCEGINKDRYFRFVNTATTSDSDSSSSVINGDTSGNTLGVCFDDVPFLGADDGLADIGHTIVLGQEVGTNGMMIAAAGTGQLTLLEKNARRSSLCRTAHDRDAYIQKVERLVLRNPDGVTPLGFGDNQYCEVDEDCRSASACSVVSDAGLQCGATPAASVETTPAPTTRPPSLRPTTRRPTRQPTASPVTDRPTPRPTDSPVTDRPTPRPTASPVTDRPTPRPTASPVTDRPTPRPTASPVTDGPAPNLTDPPTTRPPTIRPTNQPTRKPSMAPSTQNPTRDPTKAPVVEETTMAPTDDALQLTIEPPTTNNNPTNRPTPVLVLTIPLETTESPTDSPTEDTADDNNNTGTTPTISSSSDTATPTSSTSSTGTTAAPSSGSGTAVRDPEDSVTMTPTDSNNDGEVGGSNNNDDENDVETMSPTALMVPTASPTAVVSIGELPLQQDFFRVTLVLKNVVTKLGGFTMFFWEDETSEHIQEWIQTYSDDAAWDPPMEQLRVQANIVTQSLLYVTPQIADVSTTTTTTSNGLSGSDGSNDAAAAAPTTPPPPNIIGEDQTVMEARAKDDKDDDEAEENDNSGSRHNRNRRTRVRQSSRRRMQVSTSTTAEALEVVFEIAVSYRSPDTSEIDLLNVILQAFQSGDGRKRYAKRLKDSQDPTFANLSDLVLQVQSSTNGVASPDSNGGKDGENKIIVWTLIGAAVVAVAASITLFVVYMRRSETDRIKLSDSTASNPNVVEQAIFEPATSAENPLSSRTSRLSQEILVDETENDGISTLGEPMVFPGMHTTMLLDEQTASVRYAQHYMDGQHIYDADNNTRHYVNERMLSDKSMMNHTAASSSGMTLSKTGSGLTHLKDHSHIFSDNDSFEEQFAGQDECFEVSVPPGKLGIIIDLSPESGEPEVRAIRADSVLASQIKMGDRLLSVDNQTCAEMTAEEVSKLIAVKSDQECRKIMFVRRQSDAL